MKYPCEKSALPNVCERYVHLGLGWIGDCGGGLERYQHGICTAHTALGQDVRAWVQCRTPLTTDVAYPVTSFASPTEKRGVKLAKLKALAEARFRQPNLTLVTHHASVSAPIVHLARGLPHIVHFHGPWAEESAVEGVPWWKTWLQSREERKAYHAADQVITLSEVFKNLIVDRFRVRPELVHVVPGAIDSAAADPRISRVEARAKLGWPQDRPIVLTVRRLVRRVGVDVLIDAVAKLLTDKPGSDLLVMIGGTGPLKEELDQKIKNLELGQHVQLLGYVPDEQLSAAYRAADMSIVPTQSLEGFGLVVLESLATGTPAMVTPVGSLPEVVSDLSPSLVLPGASAQHICEALKGFAEGAFRLPSERVCRDYVRNRYDWAVIAPQVLNVYRLASK